MDTDKEKSIIRDALMWTPPPDIIEKIVAGDDLSEYTAEISALRSKIGQYDDDLDACRTKEEVQAVLRGVSR